MNQDCIKLISWGLLLFYSILLLNNLTKNAIIRKWGKLKLTVLYLCGKQRKTN